MVYTERISKGNIPVNECSSLSKLLQDAGGRPFVAVWCPVCFDQVNAFRSLWRLFVPSDSELVAYNLYNPWNVLNQLVVEKPLKIFREFDSSDLYQLVSDDPLHDMSDRSIVSENERFPFGKYKDLDKTITDIMDENPKYVVWCLKNYKWFAVSPTLIESWLHNGQYGDIITPEFVQANNDKAWKIITNSFTPIDTFKY